MSFFKTNNEECKSSGTEAGYLDRTAAVAAASTAPTRSINSGNRASHSCSSGNLSINTPYRGTSLIGNSPPPLGPPYCPRYSSTVGS